MLVSVIMSNLRDLFHANVELLCVYGQEARLHSQTNNGANIRALSSGYDPCGSLTFR
jgi:hypothetical protein